MARYGIATLFETFPDGYEFTEADMPLHLTHVDVCEVALKPTEFVARLREYLTDTSSFEITPTEDTFLDTAKTYRSRSWH